MRTRSKIRLDRLVAQPVALLLNGLARLLGAVLRRDHGVDPERVRVIVVAKFVGMGSIVQATPLLRALRARFPKAHLVLVTSRSNRALLPHLAEIDDALFVDDRGVLPLAWTTARTILALARRRVDLYFDLEIYSAYACVMALLSMARVRLGFYRSSARFKVGIYTHLVFFNARVPVRELYAQLGRAVAAEGEPGLPLSPLRIPEEARKRFDERWPQLAGPRAERPTVVVNPNASDLLEERRWPARSFATAIEGLVERGHAVALTGSEAEQDYVAALMESLPPETRQGVTDTSGRLALDEFLVLLERAHCVLTNDSGPMHMAVALGRPTVCLFGPCDPGHYGMPGRRVAVLYHRVFCSPCVHHTDEPPCAGDNVCMKRIPTEEVIAAVERVSGAAPEGVAAEAAGDAAGTLDLLDSGAEPLGLVVRRSILGGNPRPCQVCGGRRFLYRFHRLGQRFVRCVACGLERIDPPPEAVRYDRDYYDAWGLRDDAQAAALLKRASFRRHLEGLSRPLPPGARVLDCGAATGFFMEVAVEAGLVPYGVEISPYGAAEIARRFGAGRVFQGGLEGAHFGDVPAGGFDAVFMLDFLEHVADPAAVLASARERLASGGTLLVTTPDTGSLTRRLQGRHWIHYKAEHLVYFSRANLGTLLRRAGFRVLRVGSARKVLTLRYARHQLSAYPNPLLTPLARAAGRLLPEGLLDRHLTLSIGEMRVEAEAA